MDLRNGYYFTLFNNKSSPQDTLLKDVDVGLSDFHIIFLSSPIGILSIP